MRKLSAAPHLSGMLIDKGLADKFLAEQLHPHLFGAAYASVGQNLSLRQHAGYDRDYDFIASLRRTTCAITQLGN